MCVCVCVCVCVCKKKPSTRAGYGTKSVCKS